MRTSTFGDDLRRWRRARGFSQLELAGTAEVSQRHISFLETGRSRPSREMVIHLARVLDVPPREQNILLSAAGHSPEFSETPIDDLGEITAALDTMLEAHEPNVALVVDRHWDLIRANRPAADFTSMLLPETPDWAGPPLNIMRLAFHPDGLRRYMVDWEVTASALLRRLQRDVSLYPHDRGLRELVAEIRSYPDVDSLSRGVPTARASDLVVPATYRSEGKRYRYSPRSP